MANKFISMPLPKEATYFVSSNTEVLPVSGKEKDADGKPIQARDAVTGLPMWKFDADICFPNGDADVATIKQARAEPMVLNRRTEYVAKGEVIARPWAMKDKVTGALNSGMTYTLHDDLVPVSAAPKSFPAPNKD